MRYYLTHTLLFFFFLQSSLTFADMDCGNESIGKGVGGVIHGDWTMDKVKKNCGSPTQTKKWSDELFSKYGSGYIKTTNEYAMWTYDRGSNTFIVYLLFKNGMLIDIKEGGYGTD